MGGSGSGRWDFHQKALTVEACYWIAVGPGGLKGMKGALPPGSWRADARIEADSLMLTLRGENAGWIAEQEIEVFSWRPRFGGSAYWLLCPCCGSKRRKLFTPPNTAQFKCRRCWGLTYVSCQEAHAFDRGIAARLLAPILFPLRGSQKDRAQALKHQA